MVPHLSCQNRDKQTWSDICILPAQIPKDLQLQKHWRNLWLFSINVLLIQRQISSVRLPQQGLESTAQPFRLFDSSRQVSKPKWLGHPSHSPPCSYLFLWNLCPADSSISGCPGWDRGNNKTTFPSCGPGKILPKTPIASNVFWTLSCSNAPLCARNTPVYKQATSSWPHKSSLLCGDVVNFIYLFFNLARLSGTALYFNTCI